MTNHLTKQYLQIPVQKPIYYLLHRVWKVFGVVQDKNAFCQEQKHTLILKSDAF